MYVRVHAPVRQVQFGDDKHKVIEILDDDDDNDEMKWLKAEMVHGPKGSLWHRESSLQSMKMSTPKP